MKVLITGGGGFIGSHLADACIANGDNVVALENFSTGCLENIAHLLGHPHFEYIVGSILDAPTVERLVERCDAVYHTAAVVGMHHVVNNPVLTFKTNVLGTGIVFDAAAAQSKRVLFTSTSEIYGLDPTYPTPETGLCVLGPTSRSSWSYAYCKAVGEVLAMGYYHERGTPVIVARLFNTVGPRQTGRYGMVIPRFVQQALCKEEITVYGDGTQTRSFADVREVTRALVQLMENPRSPGQIVNVGNPHEMRIIDLAHRIIELTGSSSTIRFVPYDIAYEPGFVEIIRRIPDVQKAQQLIDFHPQMQIDSILSEIIAEAKRKMVEE